MYAKIEHKLSSCADKKVQVEIAALMALLTTMPTRTLNDHRVYFEMAFELLADDQPNMILVRSLRANLGEIRDRSGSGFSRLISHLYGGGPLHTVMSALLVVFALSFVVVALLALGHHFTGVAVRHLSLDMPILLSGSGRTVVQLMLLTHAAFLGSIVSIIVRLRTFSSATDLGSLLIFVSVVTRPFISVMLAIFAFAAMKAGVVSFLGINLDDPSGPYLAWGIGFLCGFSERLAQDLVDRAGSAIGESGTTSPTPPV